ncbi:OB-fold nucleic acid binding domain-containing protein [Rhodococcus sp. D2-41]|uniref:OB-fold nucleic acid binding domain-containing protein n=1 Tax=Speluncibacter jeojiensis TaxID=2710754 RepID=A0A9X4M217_9ACTN|nr:OB-fold nucleic acid binding domain-containing protein [Rhodococcus sp. D2-41]MDG3011398.1 OB-fold nucleic acid binding domain-containing protein [Rhodococcus sp. D2-41]MDG3016590.1 OB-fold nucleic acid binding domain-containing protein [Corynebacteriales bacterium D3-21]
MAPAAAHYFRRLSRRLTQDIDELDAEEISQQADVLGAKRASECCRGEEVTMVGRLRSVEACPKTANASVIAELFDGSEAVKLVWIGRRRIPGIEPGRSLLVRGRIGERDGGKVIYNPYYELQSAS